MYVLVPRYMLRRWIIEYWKLNILQFVLVSIDCKPLADQDQSAKFVGQNIFFNLKNTIFLFNYLVYKDKPAPTMASVLMDYFVKQLF